MWPNQTRVSIKRPSKKWPASGDNRTSGHRDWLYPPTEQVSHCETTTLLTLVDATTSEKTVSSTSRLQETNLKLECRSCKGIAVGLHGVVDMVQIGFTMLPWKTVFIK